MGVVKSVGCRRSDSIGVCKELLYDEVFIEPCEGEVENSVGGIIKPMLESPVERSRPYIPECAVFDDDVVGIGRGAEVAVVVVVVVVVVVEGTIELPVRVTDVGVLLWRVVLFVVVVVELGVAAVMEDGFVVETKEWPGLRLALALALVLASQLGWALEPELRAATEEIGEKDDVVGADDDIVVSGPAART